MFFGSAARTLLAIEDMGVENVGIVFDLGHSFFAGKSRLTSCTSCHAGTNWSALK